MSARLCILRASRNGEVVRWYYSVLMLVCLAIVGFTLGCSHGPGSSFPARDMYRLVSLTGNVTEPADLKISTYAIAEEPVIRTLLVDVLPYVNKDIHNVLSDVPHMIYLAVFVIFISLASAMIWSCYQELNRPFDTPYVFRAACCLVCLVGSLVTASVFLGRGIYLDDRHIEKLLGNELGWTVLSFAHLGTWGAILGQAWPEWKGPNPSNGYRHEIFRFLVLVSLLVASLILTWILVGGTYTQAEAFSMILSRLKAHFTSKYLNDGIIIPKTVFSRMVVDVLPNINDVAIPSRSVSSFFFLVPLIILIIGVFVFLWTFSGLLDDNPYVIREFTTYVYAFCSLLLALVASILYYAYKRILSYVPYAELEEIAYAVLLIIVVVVSIITLLGAGLPHQRHEHNDRHRDEEDQYHLHDDDCGFQLLPGLIDPFFKFDSMVGRPDLLWPTAANTTTSNNRIFPASLSKSLNPEHVIANMEVSVPARESAGKASGSRNDRSPDSVLTMNT